MEYLDKIIEVLAEWFMDLFLDPVYVVENSARSVGAVSMARYIVDPAISIDESQIDVDLIEENSLSVAESDKYYSVVTGFKRIERLGCMVNGYLTLKRVGESVVNSVGQPLLLALGLNRFHPTG